MACATANVKFQLKRATAEEWAATTRVLLDGEPGYDTTNNVLKIGYNGKTWAELQPVNQLTTLTLIIDGGDSSDN